MESPNSPLSEILSDEFDVQHSATPSPEPEPEERRPAKRQRTSGVNRRSSAMEAPTEPEVSNIDIVDAYISSDTEGSVPGSPGGGANAADDEDGSKDRVSICKWEGCTAGDLGNMDALVDHINDTHIQNRQKKYFCEWIGCTRKGISHASGYALRAHMRSHTREKPFLCALPECDRSFTRSDALAKHMRTVHETEALRPSDPVPKHHSSNPQNRQQRLRITMAKGGKENGETIIKEPSPTSPIPGPFEDESNEIFYTKDSDTGRWVPSFPLDIKFSSEELALSPQELAGLLQYQIEWASEKSDLLRREEAMWNEKREAEAVLKNLLLRDYQIYSEKSIGNGRVSEEDVQMAVEQPVTQAESVSSVPYTGPDDTKGNLEASNRMEIESVTNDGE